MNFVPNADRGEGVKNPENFADVLYVWPLMVRTFSNCGYLMSKFGLAQWSWREPNGVSSPVNHDICDSPPPFAL